MSQVNPEPLSYDNSASKGAFPPQNDKACAAMSLRHWLKRRRIREVIPSLALRTFPFTLDQRAYKRRNVIGRIGKGSRTGAVSRPDTTVLLVTTWPVWR